MTSVKEFMGEAAEIEKLPELPFDIDSIPESKNPEDPCRKVRWVSGADQLTESIVNTASIFPDESVIVSQENI